MPSTEEKRAATASPRSWFVPLALAAVGAVAWACQEPADGDGDGSATADDTLGDDALTRRDVLASIGTHVIAPSTAEFATRAATLQRAVAMWSDALATGAPTDSPRADAQAAWRDAMQQWQRLEVMQVGPAAPSLAGIGGEDLRDAIYSWPTADTCSVDRALVEQHYAEPDFFATSLVWAYGLDALEYLVFSDATNHSCPAQVQLDGPWAALGADEVERRRAAYAAVVADGIVARADELATRWATDGDDFGALLAAPGEGDSPYDDERVALDEVFRAMFYVDIVAKDDKLGVPIGALAGCAAPPCLELLEAPHSGFATDAIRANLEGLRAMVLGGPDAATGDGFDDLLAAIGEPAIADTLLLRIEEAIAACDGYDVTLHAALASDPDAAAELFAAMKAVTDELKGPFVMALMLTIPAEGAGDND